MIRGTHSEDGDDDDYDDDDGIGSDSDNDDTMSVMDADAMRAAMGKKAARDPANWGADGSGMGGRTVDYIVEFNVRIEF